MELHSSPQVLAPLRARPLHQLLPSLISRCYMGYGLGLGHFDLANAQGLSTSIGALA